MEKLDNELLESIEKRDSIAFTALYSRYKNLIYGQIDSRVPDKDAVNDIFQDFWISVWDKPSVIRIDDKGAAKKSLCFLVSCYIIRYFRAVRSSIFNSDQAEAYTAATEPSYSHVSEELLAQEISRLVDQILTKMPEIDRMIYTLREKEDWSLDQIANHLSVSKKTVSNKLSLISGEIRTQLSPLNMLIGTTATIEILKSISKLL